MNELKKNYTKILNLGGLDNIYPPEGIRFTYKNIKYKLNNLFVFINSMM